MRCLLKIWFVFLFPSVVFGAGFRPTLNILAPLGVLDPTLVQEFEIQNEVNLRVEFVTNRFEFEPRLRSGLRAYDVVIADERILQRLYLQRLIRSLPDDLIPKNSANFPLMTLNKINPDGSLYFTILADPLGIAYLASQTKNLENKSWDLLINPDKNPYWRQRVFFSNFPRHQLMLALLATDQEITTSSWFIPESATRWLNALVAQSVVLNKSIDRAFMSNEISAAVIFYSQFLRSKKYLNDLKFLIPSNHTYYERIGLAWSVSSVQENYAKKFIQFSYIHRAKLEKQTGLISLNSQSFLNSDCKKWLSFDDDIPLPKRIDNILKDLYTRQEKAL